MIADTSEYQLEQSRYLNIMSETLAAKDENARVESYPKRKPGKRDVKPNADKENVSTKKPKLSKAAAEAQSKDSDFHQIPLDEIRGETPCYDDATRSARSSTSS